MREVRCIGTRAGQSDGLVSQSYAWIGGGLTRKTWVCERKIVERGMFDD